MKRHPAAPLVAWIAAALIVACAAGASARSRVPYGGAFREQLDQTFFDVGDGPLGRVSTPKVEAYRAFVEKKMRVVAAHVYNHETIDRGRDPESARARIGRLDTTIALEHVLHLLDRMEAADDPARAYGLAAEALMVEYATRAYTEAIKAIEIPIHLKNMVTEWRVANRSSARRADQEATNLVDPATGEFYTPDELAALIRSGADLSRLDPPDRTPFWRRVDDISQVDIVRNYLEGGDPLHEGMVLEFPEFDGAHFEFDKTHMTQSKPKLDVFYFDAECARKRAKKRKKCRKKIKLKFGMETHADPPSNALLSALGFNADVSMHLKNVRVNLGDHSMNDLEKDWIGYFDQQRAHTYIPLDSVLSDSGTNEDGDYVVFHEAVAELKPAEFERIGMFPFSWGMAADFREARGLFLFNAWIANADMKDEENNKLVLKKDASGETGMYLVQQDIGHSLGRILPERPEAFPWDLVETNPLQQTFGLLNGSIELNYVNLQDTGLEHTTTYADAKWMARLIAQLTREQIEAAVALGYWPGGIPQLYVEKLINRRNQLVEAFDLTDEFELYPVDRHITTADATVVDGHLVQNRFDGSPINFDHHWRDVFGPVGDFFVDRSVRGLQAAISAIDLINPGNIRIEAKLRVIPRVIVHLSREVVLNPEPEGAFDQYIVVDSMKVGLRVGVGYIGSVEGALIKSYALAYPVATQTEGINGRLRIVNFLLPYDVWKGNLPEKYVLFREWTVKKGLRVSTDQGPFFAPFGVDADQNRVVAHRSVIDRRHADPIIWVDRPSYRERNARIFVELRILQIPFLGGGTSDGALRGDVWTVDGSKLDVAGDDGDPIFERMVGRADFREREKILLGDPRSAESEFRTSGAWWNILFASWRMRAHEEKITISDRAGQVLRQERQAERRRKFSWAFLDNGETQEFKVTGFLGARGAPAGDPIVIVTYAIDDLNTHSSELDSYYDLLEGLGSGETYLVDEFEAMDWEVSGEADGRWKRMLTEGAVRLHAGAIERLYRIDRDGYWKLLARNLGLTEAALQRERALLEPSMSKQVLGARRRLTGRHTRSVIRRSQAVFGLLGRAEAADADPERLRLVVEALYRTAFESGDTFDPVILSTLLEQAGTADLVARNELVVEARIHKAFEDEHNLPERRDAVGRLGADRESERIEYRFFPFSGIDLYNMLNWVRETE